MNLHSVLMEKAKSQKLGHFYILESSSEVESSRGELIQFVHQFIRDYYQKIEGHKQSLSHLQDHPDVFVLGNIEEDAKSDKFFKVEEAEGLSRFFEYKPIQSIRKFAVILEGHRVNTIVANKWLKLLEEPQGISTIFLLNPHRVQLLHTIHSRAIHLRLPSKDRRISDNSKWNEFIQDVRGMSLFEFIDRYSKGKVSLSFWLNELLNWETEQNNSADNKNNIEIWLKEVQEMEIYHQPSATKWTFFYQFLKENVLPRLN